MEAHELRDELGGTQARPTPSASPFILEPEPAPAEDRPVREAPFADRPAARVRTLHFQPDSASDVRIRVREEGDRLVIQTRLSAQDTRALEAEWPGLQQRLSASGVVLQPLDVAPKPTPEPAPRTASESFTTGRHDSSYGGGMAESSSHRKPRSTRRAPAAPGAVERTADVVEAPAPAPARPSEWWA